MKCDTGFDMDGVLCTKAVIDKKWSECRGYERTIFQQIKKYHCSTAPLLRKPTEKNFVIITGRSAKLQFITLDWLESNKITPLKVFHIDRNRTRNNMIDFKSEKINELELKTYYEDDPKIIKSLTRLCPNTQIVPIQSVTTDYFIKNFV